MPTSKFSITEGSGKNIATHSITEDAVTKEIQRVVVNDSSGVDLSSLGGLNVTLNKTIYTVSVLNSTTSQLTAGSTFAGAVESVLSTPNVQLQITCNQAYTVTIFQYSDAGGSILVGSKIFKRLASQPLSETILLPCDYYKITITNNGASSTTTLKCVTTLGHLPVTPIALTNNGNFPVEVGNPYLGNKTGDYIVSSFRIVGAAAVQNLMTIWNPVGSGKYIALRRIALQTDHTTLLATPLHVVSSYITAIPTGGTTQPIFKVDQTYAANVADVKGAASADGTNGTAITATAVTRISNQFSQRPHTLAGWFTTDDLFMIPERCFDIPIILAPGSGIMVHTLQNATTGAFYLVNARFDEYTI